MSRALPASPAALSATYIRRLAHVLPGLPYIPPVIADEDGSVVFRLDFYRAAKKLGLKELPVIPLERLEKKQKDAIESQLVETPAQVRLSR